MVKPLKSVTHGQCNDTHTVTFPAAQRHRPLPDDRVTSDNGVNKLLRVVTQPRLNWTSNPRPLDRKSDAQPAVPVQVCVCNTCVLWLTHNRIDLAFGERITIEDGQLFLTTRVPDLSMERKTFPGGTVLNLRKIFVSRYTTVGHTSTC